MSTAVARGMAQAQGFRGGSDKGKAERNRGGENGFFVEEEEEVGEGREELQELEALSERSSIGAASSESSSIGEDSSSEKEEEEVESKVTGPVEEVLGMGLGALECLEDALPNKRGLSNFYAGKSKSFTSLAEAAAKAAAKEIAKPENPFNKRRRVLAACSRRRASCSSLVSTYLPPLLALDHTVVEGDEDEEADERSEDDEDDEQAHNNGGKSGRERKAPSRFPPPRLSLHSTSQKGAMMRNLNPNANSFRSPRSFSLSDLQNASYN